MTKGKSSYLDVDDAEAGEILTGVVSRSVLLKIGGAKLVDAYNDSFGFT